MKTLVKLITILFGLAVLLFGSFIFGISVAILPPLFSMSVLGIAALILLWVMPDLAIIPERLIRRLFFLALFVQFTIPAYYAIALPGLPWISIRRVTWFPEILLVGLALATSSDIRARLKTIFAHTKYLSFAIFGFYFWIVISLFTSISPRETIGSLMEAFLYWYMAFITCIVCINAHKYRGNMLLLLVSLPIMAGPLGFIEFLLQKHFIYTLWPESWMRELFTNNQFALENITRDAFRNGAFRANYIYNVSLSYGEFLATVAPIGLYFALFKKNGWERSLGIVSVLCCIIGIYGSGARGGFVSLAAALPFVGTLWVLRRMKEAPHSMAGVLAGSIFFAFLTAFATLAVAWGSLRKVFTGGGEGAGSTDIRLLQWNLATPWIQSNPITGYGHGVGGLVVGYVTPSGTPSVDSYIITLLVDAGVPALLLFFSIIGISLFGLLRRFFSDLTPAGAETVAIAGAILSFGVYRIALSQAENHFLLFVLLGIAITQIAEQRILVQGAAPAAAGPPPGYRPTFGAPHMRS